MLLITDSERYGGEVSVLKAITGGDPVRYERKNVQQCKAFTPTCMVIVAANEPVISSDYTSGLERRRLTLPFTCQVKPEERRDLEKEFKPYLPGLLAWVLEMSDEEVTELLLNTSNTVRSLASVKAEFLIETNPMAEWLDACVALDPTAKTYVGVAQRDKSSSSTNTYLFTDKWLYASYCEYSAATGSKAVSVRRFSTLLHDLCVSQLKLNGINKSRDNKGAYFEGLAIRYEYDDRPRSISHGSFPLKSDGLKTESDGLVTVETLDSDGSDGSDELFISDAKKVNLSEGALEKTENNKREVGGICHYFHHDPSLLNVPAVTDSSSKDITAITDPSPTPEALAAQILKCQTWLAVISAMDAVSRAIDKPRVIVYNSVLKRFSQGDRQHLVQLLATHIEQFPQDACAYNWLPQSSHKLLEKAIAIANSIESRNKHE